MRDLTDVARDLVKSLFDTYRPELHYMRGPSPKQQTVSRADSASVTSSAQPNGCPPTP